MRQLLLLTLAGAALAAPQAHAAETWHDGPLAEMRDEVPCGFNGPTGVGASVYSGTLFDEQAPKRVGDVVYVRMGGAAVGCRHAGHWSPGLQLPQGAQLAISATHPVRCFAQVFLDGGGVQTTEEKQDCPQAPENPWGDGLVFRPPSQTSGGGWPMPQDRGWWLAIPVRPTEPLSNGQIAAAHRVTADFTPNPQSSRALFTAADRTPVISYPADASTELTATSWRTKARLQTHWTGGRAIIELGTTTAYGRTSPAEIKAGGGDVYEVAEDWSNLQPGTTYHWRLRYERTGRPTVFGADRTFTTRAASTQPKPVITYPSDAQVEVTATSWRTKGVVQGDGADGSAVLDIGTSTAYELSAAVPLDPRAASQTVEQTWTRLKPATTYHWRLRVEQGGRTIATGANRTFTTRAATTTQTTPTQTTPTPTQTTPTPTQTEPTPTQAPPTPAPVPTTPTPTQTTPTHSTPSPVPTTPTPTTTTTTPTQTTPPPTTPTQTTPPSTTPAPTPLGPPAPPAPTGGSATARAVAAVVTVPRTIRLSALARDGLPVSLRPSLAGPVAVELRAVGRRGTPALVARTTRTLPATGGVVRVRPSRAALRRLRRLRPIALELRVTAGGTTTTRRTTVRR